MSGGEHIIYSQRLLWKNLTSATLEEITIEAERFKEIYFIQRADESWYGELWEELKNGAYKEREEYPKTVASADELLINEYDQIGPCTRQRGWFNHCGRVSGRSNYKFLQNGGQGDKGGRGGYEKMQLVQKLLQEKSHHTWRSLLIRLPRVRKWCWSM